MERSTPTVLFTLAIAAFATGPVHGAGTRPIVLARDGKPSATIVVAA